MGSQLICNLTLCVTIKVWVIQAFEIMSLIGCYRIVWVMCLRDNIHVLSELYYLSSCFHIFSLHCQIKYNAENAAVIAKSLSKVTDWGWTTGRFDLHYKCLDFSLHWHHTSCRTHSTMYPVSVRDSFIW
jgi:hypothetical protein